MQSATCVSRVLSETALLAVACGPAPEVPNTDGTATDASLATPAPEDSKKELPSVDSGVVDVVFPPQSAAASSANRVWITTDYRNGGDPDDQVTLSAYLLLMGLFDTKGIVVGGGAFNNIEFSNNEVRSFAGTRSEPLFNFGEGANFSTIRIRDNIIECTSLHPRPLVNAVGAKAQIENNTLKNVSVTKSYANVIYPRRQGLSEPLKFRAGVASSISVDGWNVTP